MYFNNKDNTNIDEEFENQNILSNILTIINKYKIIIIIGLILVLGIIITIYFTKDNSNIIISEKITNYLVLSGEENITIYQGSDYIELGFEAHNSKNEDLTNDVIIKSNIDTSKIGEYEITYTIGNVTKTRKINIIEKPKEYTYIYLKTIDNNINIYLKVGETYNEPGYQVFSSTGKNLNDQVKVTGSVNTSKKGNYKLIYSVIDSNGVTISVSRIVIVMDTEINLSLSTKEYTNEDVTINVKIFDDYFDYLILPDNTKVTDVNYGYKVSSNGTYKFKVHNKKGITKEASIEVKNIDRTLPEGSCTVNQKETGSYIEINASDYSGIKKYVYNNDSYTNNIINLPTFVNSAKVTIYDNANNSKDITCKINSIATISNITKDGVIITINTKKINTEISGYYFSYTNQRPNKNTGGYIQTNKESIDVVRLPGTTYVWVEDKYGKISDYKTVTITNDALLITNGNDYKILENISLSTYLKNQGWSIEELNKLISRSVRAAGLYSKVSAATAAVSLQTVLAQKYHIKLPYWWGGKSWSYGASSNWGSYRVTSSSETTYYYDGLDCTGFVTWAYVNAGYNITIDGDYSYPRYASWTRLSYSKDNAEVGDFLINDDHIRLIIAKTNDSFIAAEAKGKAYGMVINSYSYSNSNGFKILSADKLMSTYSKVSANNYPTGF